MSQQLEETPVADRLWAELEEELAGPAQPLRILFATDGSEEADAARQFIDSLPLPAGSSIDVLTVLDAPIWQVPTSLLQAEQEWGQNLVRQTGSELGREGVSTETCVSRGAPAPEIITRADSIGADLVILGSRGHTGLQQFLLGSVARNVAKHVRRPVLIARPIIHNLHKVVLAVDESEHAVHATRFLARLPLPEQTEIVVTHILRPARPFPALGGEYVGQLDQMAAEYEVWQREQGEKLVEAVKGRLEQAGRRVETVVREGDPAAEVLRLVLEQEADLLVAGARGVSLIQGLMVGSVADRLMKNCPVSLLVVH